MSKVWWIVGGLILLVVIYQYEDTREHQFQLSCISGSMDPTITCFDVVTIREVSSPDQIKIGSIIEFPGCGNIAPDCSTVHRVSALFGPEIYQTQGDNINTNATPDSAFVAYKDVIGVVVDVDKYYPPEGMSQLRKIWVIEKQLGDSSATLEYMNTLPDSEWESEVNVLAYNRIVWLHNNAIDELQTSREELVAWNQVNLVK